MQLANIWHTFITNNPLSQELDENLSLITAAFETATKEDDFIPLLTDTKALILLSKSAFGDNIQLSYFHHLYGSVLLGAKQRLVGLTGLKHGSPIEISTKTIHSFNKDENVPDFATFITIKTKHDLANVTPVQPKPKLAT